MLWGTLLAAAATPEGGAEHRLPRAALALLGAALFSWAEGALRRGETLRGAVFPPGSRGKPSLLLVPAWTLGLACWGGAGLLLWGWGFLLTRLAVLFLDPPGQAPPLPSRLLRFLLAPCWLAVAGWNLGPPAWTLQPWLFTLPLATYSLLGSFRPGNTPGAGWLCRPRNVRPRLLGLLLVSVLLPLAGWGAATWVSGRLPSWPSLALSLAVLFLTLLYPGRRAWQDPEGAARLPDHPLWRWLPWLGLGTAASLLLAARLP